MKQYIIDIILAVLALIMTAVSFYLYVVQKAKEAAVGAVRDAEGESQFGKEKMKIAVQSVYGIIPAVLKPIFTQAFLEQLIQPIFDKMKEYAEMKYGGGGEK